MTHLAFAYAVSWTLPGIAWALVGVAVLLWGWRFADRKRRLPHCPKCRYDLRGHTANPTTPKLPITCPECGRSIKKTRQIHKPRKRRSLVALGALFVLAGVALVLHPEVKDKGGWSFVTQSTAMLIALPHLDDPAKWEVYEDFVDRLEGPGVHDWMQDDPSSSTMWSWMRRLAVRRAITAAGSKPEPCRLAAIRMLEWTSDSFDKSIPDSRKKRWIRSLRNAAESGNPDLIDAIGDAWPEDQDEQWLAEATEALITVLSLHLDPANPPLCEAVMYVLAGRNWVRVHHVDSLREILRSTNQRLLFTAMILVKDLGPAAEPLMEDVLSHITTARVASYAASTLQHMGDLGADKAREQVMHLLSSSDPTQQMTGMYIVRMNTDFLGDLLPRVLAIARRGDQNCVYAVESAASIARNDATIVLLDLLTDHNPIVRTAAAETLELQSARGEPALSALDKAATSDPDPGVREAAAQAAATIRQELDNQR